MKAIPLYLVLLFLHSALAGQQSNGPANDGALTGNHPALSATSSDRTSSAKQKQSAKSARKQAPAKPLKRTKIDASMVGYIEDAAVQSQVRVRFDAGFNAPRPDRAEYFYAGCDGSSGCAGAIQRTLNFQQLYLGRVCAAGTLLCLRPGSFPLGSTFLCSEHRYSNPLQRRRDQRRSGGSEICRNRFRFP